MLQYLAIHDEQVALETGWKLLGKGLERKDAPPHESLAVHQHARAAHPRQCGRTHAWTGEVLIDIKAAGLCHSNVGLLEDEGWLQTLAKRPITIGHEVAGVISGLGDGVPGWDLGDRVGICPTTEAGPHPAMFVTVGSPTRRSPPHLCSARIPDNVSFMQGAAGTDAGMTSHHAVIANGEV